MLETKKLAYQNTCLKKTLILVSQVKESALDGENWKEFFWGKAPHPATRENPTYLLRTFLGSKQGKISTVVTLIILFITSSESSPFAWGLCWRICSLSTSLSAVALTLAKCFNELIIAKLWNSREYPFFDGLVRLAWDVDVFETFWHDDQMLCHKNNTKSNNKSNQTTISKNYTFQKTVFDPIHSWCDWKSHA